MITTLLKGDKAVRNCLISVFILVCTQSWAHPLTPDEAVARMKAKSGQLARRLNPGQRLQLAHTEAHGDTALLYVMNGADQFYFLSADDCAPAVLGYSSEGNFDKENIPDALKWWMSEYADNIASAIRQESQMKETHVAHEAIGPLLTTTWRQEEPFNNLCNDVATGCQTGCVATAMAQIMYYHKWPLQGTGSYSYKQNDITISSDFSQHTYDWEHILTNYNYFGNNAESEDAVALLMRDCGVAVEMNYSPYGSGATNAMAAYALHTYFGYDGAMRNNFRSYFTDEEWEQLLLDDLAQGHPIFYSGASSNAGGHAFVCDGYDGNGYFHFNWGWGGGCDGFFLVTGTGALNPYRTTNDGDAFSIRQMALTGIQPEKGGQLTETNMGLPSGFTLSATTVRRDTVFTYASKEMYNTGTRPVKAKTGLKFVHTQTGETFYYPFSTLAGTYELKYIYMDEKQVGAAGCPCPHNGTYHVYPVFMDTEERNPKWREMQLPLDFEVPTIEFTGAEPDIYLADYPLAYSHGLHTRDNKVKPDDIKIRLNLQVQNDISSKYIYIYVYPANGGYSVAYAAQRVTANAGDKLQFDLIPTPFYTSTTSITAGNRYMLQVKYDNKAVGPSSEFSTFYIQTVEDMPSISYLSKQIQQLPTGEVTKDDIDDTKESLLNPINPI